MSELTLLHVGSGEIGYGRYGVELHKQLTRMGVDVYDDQQNPVYNPASVPDPNRRAKKTNVVCWVSVPTHARGWYEGQFPVVSTMFETTELPEGFRESFHNFPLLIVPSQQNLELFSQYHSNVALVPLGVDPDVWHFQPRRMPTNEFRFLIGGRGERKGTDLAYKAFCKVFRTWPKDMPVPKLIMKSPKPEDYYGERIERVGGRITPEAEVDLYASAHCYLQPSRGEGFGLQPLQAIAQGCPTILTNAHGHEAFAHLGYGLDTSPAKAAYFIYGDAGDWWEPDFNQLCELMEFVYLNYEPAVEVAAAASEVALDIFTWAKTAETFCDVLGGAMDVPYSGDGSWFVPDVKRYRLVTDRDYQADIAGVSYQFKAGVEYQELADVKRILFEGGVLDPVCIADDDSGLTVSQIKEIGSYTAAHSWCALCQQKLGSGIQRADEIEAAMA